jgi:hypothetical protein
MARPPGHLPGLGLWLLAAALIVRLVVQIAASAGQPAHGFVAHYAASRILLEGTDAVALYDDTRFIGAVQLHEPTVVDIFGANPPTVALLAVPLAGFDYPTARLLWTILSLAGWLAAVWWLARTLAIDGVWLPALLCVAATFQPAIENLRHGQFHVLVLVLVLIAWHGLRRGRSATAGRALAFALALKAAGVAFWPLLLARRQWRALAWGLGTVAVFAAFTLLLSGLDVWPAFLRRAGDTAAAGSLSVTAYQTVPGLVRRLTVADAQWNPSPLVDLGVAGVTVSWLAAAALLIGGLAAARRLPLPDAFASFAALGLALSPVSLDYHYVLAIFPIAVALAGFRGRLKGTSGVVFLVAVALIALDLPYRSPAIGDGVVALLAYPKLYGVLGVWGVLLRGRGLREESDEDVE